jgi:TRAP-type C4-dicarboxylate transport system substrate-binding protein
MVRKIRMGILGGAVFTNIGITEMNPDSYIFNFPFFLDSDDELDFIMTKVTPLFEKNIEKKGFKVIVWSNAGWVYFFSKKPIFYPKDLKKCTLSFSTGITAMANAWRKSGYRIVPNELKDTMMALQSGMVDSFYLAKNMYQLKIAPVVGGVIISNKIWKHIPDEFKNKMINVAKKMEYNLSIKTKKLEKDAIREMKKHGLRINNAPADALEKWRTAANKGLDKLVGKAFSEEIYNLCKQYIEEYRKKTPNEKQNKRNN